MSPEQQRIKIAECCGVKLSTVHSYGSWMEMYDSNPGLFNDYIPDYLNDLNAMHEAEKVLSLREKMQYMRVLCANASSQHENNILTNDEVWHICAATAAQRAEAFLKTKGLWIEEKKEGE